MNFQDLPPKTLSKIFGYMTFSEVFELRGVSRRMHRTVREHFNSAFLELGPRLYTQYTDHLISTKSNNARNCPRTDPFRGRLLRLLSSEHSILLALCRNYIMNGEGYFSSGEILELFHELQWAGCSRETEDEENKKLAKLVLLIDRYLDWFEVFRMTTEKKYSWYGTCVVDLLDSYLSSTYHAKASHRGPLVKFTGRYVINGKSEEPPKIGKPLGCPVTKKELCLVLKYLRKHARWCNFVDSFRDETGGRSRFDDDPREKVYTKRTASGYERKYKKEQSVVERDKEGCVEHLTAEVSLRCNRSSGPSKLRGGFEELQEWSRDLDTFAFEVFRLRMHRPANRDSEESSRDTETTVEEDQDEGGASCEGDESYSFALEIRSVHPRVGNFDSDTDEKFVEIMLHVIQTNDTMFATRTECGLY